jgi:hypothetical protein
MLCLPTQRRMIHLGPRHRLEALGICDTGTGDSISAVALASVDCVEGIEDIRMLHSRGTIVRTILFGKNGIQWS